MFGDPKKSAAAGMFFGSSAAAMLAASRSFLLGLIDLVYNLYRRFIAQPRRNRWFSAGYGDLQSYYYAVDNAMAEWKRDGLERYLSKPLRVTWRKIDSGDPAVLCDEGFFVSPLSRYIGVPDAVKMARFLFVRAAPGGPLPPTRCIVVHTAATGVYRDQRAVLWWKRLKRIRINMAGSLVVRWASLRNHVGRTQVQADPVELLNDTERLPGGICL